MTLVSLLLLRNQNFCFSQLLILKIIFYSEKTIKQMKYHFQKYTRVCHFLLLLGSRKRTKDLLPVLGKSCLSSGVYTLVWWSMQGRWFLVCFFFFYYQCWNSIMVSKFPFAMKWYVSKWLIASACHLGWYQVLWRLVTPPKIAIK